MSANKIASNLITFTLRYNVFCHLLLKHIVDGKNYEVQDNGYFSGILIVNLTPLLGSLKHLIDPFKR